MSDKYDFYKLKSKTNSEPLPKDINDQIELLAAKINDTEGSDSLKKYRENRWFGKVTLWDKKSRLISTAFFDHGICFRYEVHSYRKDDILPLSILSIKNEKLNSEKKGGLHEEER